jgi:methyl-accepting chemotaxis protein
MAFLRNLSFTQRLILGFAAVLLPLVLGSGFDFWELGRLHDAQLLTARSFKILDASAAFSQAMVDQETGLRGYLLSGNASFLEPMRAGQKVRADSAETLSKLLADNPEQTARFEAALKAAQDWESYAAKEIASVNAGTTDDARDREAAGAGKAAMDRVRAEIAGFQKVAREAFDTRLHDEENILRTIEIFSIGGGVVLFLIAAGVIFYMVRGVAHPLVTLTGQTTRLAEGDLEADIPGTERRDEVGRLAQAIAQFKEAVRRARALEAEQRKASEAQMARAERVGRLVSDFDAAFRGEVEQLSRAVQELNAVAEAMRRTAEQTNGQVAAAVEGAERSSANVQTVAAAAEELAASIQEVTRQITTSAEVAGRARAEAERTDEAVRGLAEAVQKIDSIVALISDIAGQTNLLALNATIEAARAGDAGKGFAVVASEVKQLATQTARATEDIAQQIAAVRSVTESVVQAIRGIGATINEVSGIATSVASAAEEQAAATQEITRNIAEAARHTAEVSETIGMVRNGANETGAAAQQVASSAHVLEDRTTHIRHNVTDFLDAVRAA